MATQNQQARDGVEWTKFQSEETQANWVRWIETKQDNGMPINVNEDRVLYS